jgi:hypothetical protein
MELLNMDRVISHLNQLYTIYRRNHECLMFFEYFCQYFIEPRELNKELFCLRTRQYYYVQNIYKWKYWPDVKRPFSLGDPFIKNMYLEEQKEKRLTLWRGSRCSCSPLYRLVEKTHLQTILEFAGLRK